MISFTKYLLIRILKRLGYSLIQASTFEILNEHQLINISNNWSKYKDTDIFEFVLRNSKQSKSQLAQDLVALYVKTLELEESKSTEGFFVEFGATNGITLSNTYMLEKKFGWTGVLCEPAKIWRDNLTTNRECELDFRCVYHSSGESVSFFEVQDAELSGVEQYLQNDVHVRSRRSKLQYSVDTVSLNDLLVQHHAPETIDFMSIDTEGSELSILERFDFDRWKVNFFAIEHNYTSNEKKLDQLMHKNGYVRVLSHASKWDAWYVPAFLAEKLLHFNA